ncbi:hypothetical protein SKAU_G00262070 [Synaphobranchus kaupii]|uniref:Uncharacterized protein n=1 Tax=Synaphobranchus kaupii TaxID=118154 RepID=A0A9Q1EYM5_SYNKA|nr:hypothetical protein SKAU_G00262070 [Synaphobranchus kaupii]
MVNCTRVCFYDRVLPRVVCAGRAAVLPDRKLRRACLAPGHDRTPGHPGEVRARHWRFTRKAHKPPAALPSPAIERTARCRGARQLSIRLFSSTGQ